MVKAMGDTIRQKLMKKDIISEQIIVVFNNFEEEHELEDMEKDKVANMISCVVRSDLDTRLFFYTEVSKILEEVVRRLDKKKEELIDELMGNKKQKIIN